MLGPLSMRLAGVGWIGLPAASARQSRQQLKVLLPLCAASGCQWKQHRLISSKYLTKNLELYSPASSIVMAPGKKSLLLQGQENMANKHLVILFSWLMSQKKHVMKFSDFYLNQGFDVLLVRISPRQLMWPVKGSILVGLDILEFLQQNPVYQVLLLHGFSVGAYLWGQTMVSMLQKPNLYRPIADRVVGQVWDSPVDIQSVPEGTAAAVFPNNTVLRKSLQACINSHMKIFYSSATVHYIAAREAFYKPVVKAPALCLYSLDDPVAKAKSICDVQTQWMSQGIQTYEKVWDKSHHVSHFANYRQEYTHELTAFLERLGLQSQFTDKKMAL